MKTPHDLGGVPADPDLRLLEGVVSDTILTALTEASSRLTEMGIPHAIIGGLAVGAWGYPRATKDIDFLVKTGDVFELHGNLLTFQEGIPISVQRVAVDYLTAEEYGLEQQVGREPKSKQVITIEGLFLLKLRAWRRQDQTDLAALIKAGAPAGRIRKWVTSHADAKIVARLDSLLQEEE